jgi:hypothetical protein
MANERALGVSFIYAVQTWRQLAAVAEPARGCGRILIIASAGVEPPARAPQSSPSPLGRSPSRRPRPRKRRGGRPAEQRHQPGCLAGHRPGRCCAHRQPHHNGVQDSSAIPANVTTQATTQLEAGVPFTSDSDPKAQVRKANVPPDQAGCDSESQQRGPPRRAAPRCGWSRSSPSSPGSSPD